MIAGDSLTPAPAIYRLADSRCVALCSPASDLAACCAAGSAEASAHTADAQLAALWVSGPPGATTPHQHAAELDWVIYMSGAYDVVLLS